ncbi:MAG: hypothetical protein HDS57_02055 [Barnesiella sp.]|nr:hypothetical protein [Barnesiella sp.]
MELNISNENHPISIDFKEEYENYNLNDYLSEKNQIKSRILPDKQHEEGLISDYSGRELYEIIQNADDAQASVIEIELDYKQRLHIRNDGGKPFTNKGIISVLRPNQSSKAKPINGGETIGNKGLGIRSLLNWSEGITIHSNGVKLEFSSLIANKQWEMISSKVPSLKPLEKDRKCPLAILSVPIVTEDEITAQENNKGQWTTEIEIACNPSVLSDVKLKIRSLRAEILLFLNHIRKIILKIDGEETIELSRGEYYSAEYEGHNCKMVDLQEAASTFHYVLCREEMEMPENSDPHKSRFGEVAAAFPIDSERKCEYLFSYFPTTVPLNLPCALHANFDLDTSRNGVVSNGFNKFLMTELAKILIKAAELRGTIIKHKKSSNLLLPLQMLTLEGNVSSNLPEFATYIEIEFNSCEVIPTIDGNYKSFDNGIYYTNEIELGDFANKIININSLLSNYIEYETNITLLKSHRKSKEINELYKELSELARCLTIEENADLIIKLLKVKFWEIKPEVIRLDSDQFANSGDTVYVLVSKDASAVVNQTEDVREVAPAPLRLKILHPVLSKYLQKSLNKSPRELTDVLKKFVNASDADFSRIKLEIETQSEKLPIEELNDVLLWLYKRWKKIDSSEAPISHKFKLFNESGERRQVCSLLISTSSPKFKLNEVHINSIPIDDQKSFLIYYLGCAEALPLRGHCFTHDPEYINETMGDGWWESVKRVPLDSNVALIPCEDFIKSLTIEEILTLILSDNRFLKIIYGGQRIAYSYYGDKEDVVHLSYSIFWLTHVSKVLSSILNFVIPNPSSSLDFSILNDGIVDIDKIEGFATEQILDLLKKLGAKENPLDLTFAQLYQLIENQTDVATAQKNYRELRSIIKDKKDKLNQTPTENERAILKQVWAIGPNGEKKRMPKGLVYYWDNSRLPKRFLETLWKIMLPSRTGEISVSEIFGVKLLSNLNLRVIGGDNYNENLTDKMRSYLFNRLKYLLIMTLNSNEYKPATIREKAGDIKGFINQLRISQNVKYQYHGKEMDAVDGDIINDMDNIYICTSLNSIDEVLKSPQMCNNLAKGLCMKLKLGADNEVRFVHVIQSSLESVEYEWNELDKTLKDEVERVIGLSGDEIEFWERLEIYLESKDADPVIRREKILSIYPNINIPNPLPNIKEFTDIELYNFLISLDKAPRESFRGLNLLGKFYRSQLEVEAIRLALNYKAASFIKQEMSLKSTHTVDSVYSWLKKLEKFDAEVKLIIDQQATDQIITLEELLKRFIHTVERKFQLLNSFVSSESLKLPEIKPQYKDILARYNVAPGELNYNEQALGFFDGFDTEFENIVKGKVDDDQDCSFSDEPLTEDTNTVSFESVQESTGRGTGNGGFVSSQKKERVGKKAEERVRKYLESHPELYESITDASQRHEVHCDIIYKLKNEPTLRYLEVKSVNSGKIHFSIGEIRQGEKYPETYDLALVYDDKIKIIQYAFRKDGELLKNLTPSGYEINFILSEDMEILDSSH